MIFKKENVQVISGNAGISKKTNLSYAMIEVKDERNFKNLLYISPATDEQMNFAKEVNKAMGLKLVVTTSIEALK